jgi:predicted CopG family antitoxin
MTRKQISLKQDTYSHLEELKRQGQSFDGVIQELIQEQTSEVEA